MISRFRWQRQSEEGGKTKQNKNKPLISAAHRLRTRSWKISRTCASCDADKGSGFLDGTASRAAVVVVFGVVVLGGCELVLEPLGVSVAIVAIDLLLVLPFSCLLLCLFDSFFPPPLRVCPSLLRCAYVWIDSLINRRSRLVGSLVGWSVGRSSAF